MDDMRHKLLPIFLNDAERHLQSLRQFLAREDLASASLDELETAFLAARTLKGTANLVQAESICKIGHRLEMMLKKHYAAHTAPTQVEHEAMQLAVDWLVPLLAALHGELQEPKLFVTEALQALDLAAAFPGRTPLVELIDSHSQQRSPQLDDPFATDPDLLIDEIELLSPVPDPFAEDPSFGMELNLTVDEMADSLKSASELPTSDDPFADDYDFATDDQFVGTLVSLADQLGFEPSGLPSAKELPFDLFAEDDDFAE